MTEPIVLSKILRIREQEKMDAQKAYQQSMSFFEDIAGRLYSMLKKKEKAEIFYERNLQESVSVEIAREQSAYIECLNKQIIQLQTEVNAARNKMNSKQIKLTDAHIEVKKFEQIINNRIQEKNLALRRYENELMDDVSIQQYLRGQTGE
jgi:flagellar FliJ protein